MTNVDYAVEPGNAFCEYFSNIATVEKGRCYPRPFAPACVGCSHVFRKRPQGVARTLSAAKQGEAERLCDGCPCVGAEEICGSPSLTYPCRSEGERSLPSQQASQPSTKELNGASLPYRKNVKRFTYKAAPDSARVKKLCF